MEWLRCEFYELGADPIGPRLWDMDPGFRRDERINGSKLLHYLNLS